MFDVDSKASTGQPLAKGYADLRHFRPYSLLPAQIPLDDKPRYKSGQYVPESIQIKVIQ